MSKTMQGGCAAREERMRPTTRDLAKAAGVSLATVDRVLNNRPNISERTVRKVNEAIEQIGFVRNIAAVNLVKNTVYRFRFILPETGDQFIDEIIREIRATNEAVKAEMLALDVVRLPIEDPHLVANHLMGLAGEGISGFALMAPESPQVRDAIARNLDAGIKVVLLLSGNSGRGGVDVVGIDNRAAGATAARLIGRFNGRATGKVLVIAETMRAQDSIERRLGFDGVINADFPELSVLPSLETHADTARTERILGQSLRYNPDVRAVYVMASEARMPLVTLSSMMDLRPPVIVVHERTPFTMQSVMKGEVDAIIAQDPGHAVRSAVRILKARSINLEPLKAQEKIRIEVLVKDNL